jgi:hypothetical protein
MATHHLKLSEVIQAFDELGGEADWPDVETRVIEKRGNGFAPYKDWLNYKNTMFQFVQQHCEGYRKFNGDIRFVKVRDTRFRLASLSPTAPERHRLPPENIHPETVPEGKEYVTGAVRQILINAYERDPEARKTCIQHYGTICAVCGVNFEERYGPIGKGFIHVHHRKPLATREIYSLDPINDLIPVCPNCHSMLHSSNPPLSVEQLKALMADLIDERRQHS